MLDDSYSTYKIYIVSRHFHSFRKFLPYFVRYLCIGGLVAIVDIGTLQSFISLHLYRPLAVTIAYALAVVSHFTINKYFNFRNFDRSIARQLRTYLVVVIFCWVVTVVAIEIGVRGLGLSTLQAKLIAVVLNIPTGYLGNYYLTFGSGIRATLRRWRN